MQRRSLLRLARPLKLKGFRLLFFSTVASSIGTLLAAVALAIDVKDRTNSGLWVGGLMVVEFLPTIAVGLFLGPLLDRLSRRGLMVGADLVRAAVFCALPFAPGAGSIVALAAVAGLATGFFRPAAYAGVPNLVSDEELPAANSLLQSSENASWAIGPVIGGVLTAAAGPHTAYWINAVTFLVSGLMVAQIPQKLLQSSVALSRGHWRDLRDGVEVVLRSRPLLTVLVAWTIAAVGIGIGNVVEMFLATDTFSAGDFGYGLVFGSVGVGLVLGNLVVEQLEARVGVAHAYGIGIGLIATGFALVAVSPNVWVAAVCFCLSGVGNGIAGVCNALLVQRGAEDEMRGRAVTLVMSTNFVAIGAGMAFAGPLLGCIEARGAIGLAAGIFAVAAAVGTLLARSSPREAGPAPAPDAAL